MAKYIRLGVPLDLLLNRECKLSDWEGGKTLFGGLRVPTTESPANCSIILRGRPGTGKSILALQIAVNCCRYNRDDRGLFSVYLSLEESWPQVCGKATSFGWREYVSPIASLTGLDAHATPEQCGNALRRILTRPEDCPLVEACPRLPESGGEHRHKLPEECLGRVLVGSLSPRSLRVNEADSDAVFAARYRQLECLLCGANWLRKSEKDEALPRLGLVCVDSLNTFGDQLLTREQIHRLFDLFQRQQTIGIFVMEEDEGQLLSPDARLHSDTIEYLSDAVITLRADEDSDYFVRYFEIVKSRYQHQVYGKHPFRIISGGDDESRGEDAGGGGNEEGKAGEGQ